MLSSTAFEILNIPKVKITILKWDSTKIQKLVLLDSHNSARAQVQCDSATQRERDKRMKELISNAMKNTIKSSPSIIQF